jgi:hypothetical protein
MPHYSHSQAPRLIMPSRHACFPSVAMGNPLRGVPGGRQTTEGERALQRGVKQLGLDKKAGECTNGLGISCTDVLRKR